MALTSCCELDVYHNKEGRMALATSSIFAIVATRSGVAMGFEIEFPMDNLRFEGLMSSCASNFVRLLHFCRAS